MKKNILEGALSLVLLALAIFVCSEAHTFGQQANSWNASLTPFAVDSVNTVTYPAMPFTPGEAFTLPPGDCTLGFYLGGAGGSTGFIFAVPLRPSIGIASICGSSVDIAFMSPAFYTLAVVDLSNPSNCQAFPPCQSPRWKFYEGDVIGLSVQAAVFNNTPCGLTLSNAFYIVK